jgi:hypothetical protein
VPAKIPIVLNIIYGINSNDTKRLKSNRDVEFSNIVEFCRQLDEIMKNYHHGESLLMNDLLEVYELKGIINTDTLTKLI